MRKIFSAVGLAMVLSIGGCTKCNSPIWSSEGVECERLRVFWERMGEENPQIIIPEINTEFGHESGDEMTWQELGEMVFLAADCCFSKPHPLSNEWMEYNRLECIWLYLENENILRVAFYENIIDEDTSKPEDWQSLWAEILEPERIRETIKLLCKAMERGKDRFANEGIVLGHYDRMQVMTDKHKFIIPIGCGSSRSKAIYGIGWTSYELKKKLTEWGYPRQK